MVKNLKKPDLVARQKPPFYTTDITDADYAHAKRICKELKIKYFGEHHDLYVPGNILLSADVSENLKKCLTICELEYAKFISASSWIS